MDISQDEFYTLCNDVDVGGISRELSSHREMCRIIEFIASNQKCLPAIVGTVNKYLMTAEYRNKGFQVLHIVLKHFPVSLVEEKAVVWSNFAMEFNRVDTNSERLLVLAKLIQICSTNQNVDFNRNVTSGGLLKRIIDKCMCLQSLLKSGLSTHYAIIYLLNICIQTYPGSCGNYKTQIETFLIRYLDVPNKEGVIEEAGASLHYLQQTGPAGPNQSNYINAWCNQLKKLCATIHALSDHLFEDDIEMSAIDKPEVEGYKFEHMNSCDSLNTVMLNGRRLVGLIKFLEEMLRNAYPAEKQIHSTLILGVIQRVMSIRMNEDNKHMVDNYNSQWILQIKLNALHTFKHWINIMGSQSAMFQPIIFYILLDSMRDIEKPSNMYREHQLKFYDILSFYVNQARPGISKNIHEQLIQHFLKFIKPTKTNVELNIDVSIVGKSAKGKKRSIDQRIIESGKSLKNLQEAEADKDTREKVCAGALKALNKLFETVHVKISEKTCLSIFNTIIPILNDLHESTPRIPYDNENCQIEIYNFLLKLYDQPFLPRHLSLSLGLMYFTSGMQNANNQSVKVTEACGKALYILEKTCQPMCSSLYESGNYFQEANEASNEQESSTNKRKKVASDHEDNGQEQSFIDDVTVNIENAIEEDIEEINDQEDNAIDSLVSNISTQYSPTYQPGNSSETDCSATILLSPTCSGISSSPSKPSSKSSNKKFSILMETIIPSPNTQTEQTSSSPTTVKTSPQESIDLDEEMTEDEGLFKSPSVNISPNSSTSEEVQVYKPTQGELIEIKDDDDRSSTFSKDTILLGPKREPIVEDTENMTMNEIMNFFVPDTNF